MSKGIVTIQQNAASKKKIINYCWNETFSPLLTEEIYIHQQLLLKNKIFAKAGVKNISIC